MVNIKALLCARLVSLFCAAGLTLAVVGLSGKSLSDLAHDRQLLKKPPYSILLPNAHINATDVVGVLGACCAAAGFGVIVTFISELILWREERKGIAAPGTRYLNEFLLGFASIFMLAVTIAATIIVLGRSATITSNGKVVDNAKLAPLLKSVGKSLRYRDFKTYPAMICAWFCFFFLLLSFFLVIAAGLHYRKRARERSIHGVSPVAEKNAALPHEHTTAPAAVA